jgi:hypothetical protein
MKLKLQNSRTDEIENCRTVENIKLKLQDCITDKIKTAGL